MEADRLPTRPDAVATGLLPAAGLLFLALAAYAVLWSNLPPDHQHPFGLHPPSIDLFRSVWPYPTLEIDARAFAWLGSTLVGLQWIACLAAVAFAGTRPATGAEARGRVAVAVTAVLAAFVALYFPTILSGDVYHYALQGRIFSIHGLNPYVVTGAAVPGDPFHDLAVWRDVTSQYGPLWNLVSAGIVRIAETPAWTAILFKLVGAAGHVACTWLILRLGLRFPGIRADVAAILFGWNPTLLLEAAGSGHNDAFMLALALGGIAALEARRSLFGIALLAASIAVKYLTGLLALLAVVHLLARETPAVRLRRVLLWGSVGSATLLLLYLPFVFDLTSLQQLVAGISTGSNPMPNRLAALTQDGVLAHPATGTFAFALVVAGAALCVCRAHATMATVMLAYGLLCVLYALVLFGGSFAWYLTSPFAAAVLGTRGRTSFYLTALLIGIGASWTAAIVWIRPLATFG